MACTVSDHKCNPTAEASTLLLPYPFKCWHTPDGSSSLSVFHHTSQMPASPLSCFLQSSSSSLFTLSLSLPFCDLVRENRENPCRDRQSSASDREAHRLWSLTANEAHRSSCLTDLWSWRLTKRGDSAAQQPTDKQTTRAQSHQLRAHRSKAQSQQPTPPPPTRLHLFCSFCLHTLRSSLTVTTFHLIAESPHLLFSINCRQHTLL